MNAQDEIPLFPVAAMTVGPVLSMGIVVMRPDFLSHSMQDSHQPTQGRTYAMTPPQAVALIDQLQRALAKLESTAGPTPPGPAH